ncbi:MAG: hypothetical protein PHU25_05715 [Deltaproteobacteria bacterium]|nr:hypothetical protein [Deltaproteobacteria bacterium]
MILASAAPLAAQDAAAQRPKREQAGEGEGGKDGHDFAWFSVAPEVGYAYFAPATITVMGFDFRVEPRSSVVVKAHLDLGGDGLALELAPLYSWEWGSGTFGNFNALGAELTFAWRFRVGSFYPGLGLGLHCAYIMGDDISSGAECYGRLPVGFTWYFAEYAALVFEVGLMYGGTGIRARKLVVDVVPSPSGQESAQQAANDALASNVSFGTGFAVDVMLGLRFP